MGQTRKAGRILDELESLVSPAVGIGVDDIIARLEKHARTCERELGTLATLRLQAMYFRLIFVVLAETRPRKAATILRLSQLLKGDTWRAVYLSGAGRAHRPSDAEEKNLCACRETMYVSPSPKQEMRYGSAGFRNRESLLVTPVSAEGVEVDIMKLTGTRDSRLADLWQHVYSLEVQRSLSAASESAEPLPIGLEEMAQLIDADTVMLDFLFFEREGIQHALITVVTQEDAFILLHRLPGSLLPRMWADGIALNNSPIAIAVLQLRAEAQAAADAEYEGVATKVWPRILDDPTSSAIPKALVSLLCDLRERRDKRHLCIIPHGPLHFAPLQLLRPDGRPLADDWTVTILPNAALLRASENRMSHRDGVAAFAVSYEDANQFALTPLPETRDEAKVIADAFGTQPFVDRDATKRAFLDALESSRFVHLAAHGTQNAIGPALHSVYLHPDEVDDGRLFAFEVLGRDLRRLQLVTLSACETALGRFDLADNLFGFPDVLFLCGAQSVVGTLWEVDSATAQTFFESFYNALRRNITKRDAFRQAQQLTRAIHPKSCDWGAFCYRGT